MADCGLRRITPVTIIGRIADCTLGTAHCKYARLCGLRIGGLWLGARDSSTSDPHQSPLSSADSGHWRTVNRM
eukprot:15434870-Alexandrium_andersonii.AAC.1